MDAKTKYVPMPVRTIVKTMEERNTCPDCGSTFVVIQSVSLCATSRLRNCVRCVDCGKEFNHIYKLEYAFSELLKDEGEIA